MLTLGLRLLYQCCCVCETPIKNYLLWQKTHMDGGEQPVSTNIFIGFLAVRAYVVLHSRRILHKIELSMTPSDVRDVGTKRS